VWHALRSGEPKYVVMALTGLSALESIRGTRYARHARRLITQAEIVAKRLGDPWTTGRTQLADGIYFKANGHWKESVDRLETAVATFSACRGVRWEVETAQTLRYDALYWMGEWERLARELPGRRAEAEQRGDRYTINNVAIRFSPLLQIAADQLPQARKECEDSRRLLPEGSFPLLDRLAVCTAIDLELYAGDAAAADDRFSEAWARLEPMCRVWQNGRIEMLFYRARIALALAAQAKSDAARHAALGRAEADARKIESDAPWGAALASLVHAAIRHARGGDASATITSLEASRDRLNGCHMAHYAAAVDYRRGLLLGGAAGSETMATASGWMRAHHMSNPAAMVELLAPGPWPAADARMS